MADKSFAVQVILGVVDKASVELQKFEKTITDNEKSIEKAGLAMTAFGAGMVTAFGVAVKAAGSQEAAIRKLELAVESAGIAWDKVKPSVDEFVNSMVRMTSYSDDEVRDSLQRLVTYTGDLDKAMQGTKIAMGMAATGMFDFDGASRLVGMALNGNVEMLGRFMPEFRGANAIMLQGMTSAEKASYAMDVLGKKFGSMATGEMSTFNGVFKQTKNGVEDLTEDIGDLFIPQAKDMVVNVGYMTNGMRTLIAEHQPLSQAIATTTTSLALMSTGVGTLLLSLPTLTKHINVLWTTIAAHPLVATTVAVAALATGLLALANAYVEEQNKNVNTGKTHADRIKLLQDERQKLVDLLSDNKLTSEERQALEAKTLAVIKAIKFEEVQAEKDKNAQLALERDLKNQTDYAALIEANRIKMAETDLYYQAIEEYQARLQAAHNAKLEQMKNTWVGSWTVMYLEAMKQGANYYNYHTGLMNSINSSMTSSFATAFNKIGQGWTAFKDLGQGLTDAIKNSFLNMMAQMLTDWILKHTLMTAASVLWGKKEVAVNAAVAGSKAAAASAWTLWGAIAIGAAIMAAVAAFAGTFETGGIIGGGSYSGDNIVARVNSGEMVLNRAQQARLFEIANGAAAGGSGVTILFENNTIVGAGGIDEVVDIIGDKIMRRINNERNV